MPFSTDRPECRHTVTADSVLTLQSMRAYPSVTILVSTQPGLHSDPDAITRLRTLRDRVADRLTHENLFTTTGLMSRIDDLIAQATELPAGHGLALFASESHEQVMVLPVAVEDRAVVDPTFATRDLVRAMHRTPRHLALVFSEREARLLEGLEGRLVSVAGSKFPRFADSTSSSPDQQQATFLAEVDHALGTYLRVHSAPLFLVGPEPTLSAFRGLSRNLDRLAGTVIGHHLHVRPEFLSARIAPRLEEYLQSRQSEALELLSTRTGQTRTLHGIDSVWLGARWERPEMLAVEIDYFYPARLSEDGDFLTPAEDIEHPSVIDDCVDEIVERVLERGGWVALVHPGSIPNDSRIALTVKDS